MCGAAHQRRLFLEQARKMRLARDRPMQALTPPDLALLRMARAMADTPSNVSDQPYAELRKHFSG